MKQDELIQKLRALTPEELLSGYRKGVRDFSRVNLLRAELECAVLERRFLGCVENPTCRRYNPLWVDFLLFAGERDFKWDSSGRCLSVEEVESPLDPPSRRNLSGADLTGIDLSGSYLYPIDFTKADLSGANLRHAIFIDCLFSSASLKRADLRGAHFFDCSVDAADFYMARMERVHMIDCDARGARLERAKLRRAGLIRVDLRDACLQYAHCDLITIAGDLRGVDLCRVRLPGSSVTGSTITARQVRPLLRALVVEVALK